MEQRPCNDDCLGLGLILILRGSCACCSNCQRRGSTKNHRADGKQRREFTAGVQHGEVPLTGHAIEIAVTFPRGGEGNMYCPSVPV